jgi:hypothetical protein
VANVLLMKRLKRKWLRQQSKKFCAAGFDALVKQWDKCINVGGGYVKKYMAFPCSNIHILRFIFICDLFTDSPSYQFYLIDKKMKLRYTCRPKTFP